MNTSLKSFVEEWNKVMDQFQITIQNLQKPQSMFFVQAVVKLLEMLNVNVDQLIQDASHNTECSFAPVVQLTQVVNFLLESNNLHTEFLITPYDFILPTTRTMTSLLMVLLNHLMFIQEANGRIADKKQSVDEMHNEIEVIKRENDKVNTELDETLQKLQKARDHIEKIVRETKDSSAKNVKPEAAVNELKSEYDLIQENKKMLNSELEKKKSVRIILLEKIRKTSDSLITESEQMEILKNKETENQNLKEIQDKIKELSSTIWKKGEDIQIFKSSTSNSYKLETELNELESIYSKIKSIENSGKNSHESEKKIREMDEINAILSKEESEKLSFAKQSKEEILKLKTSLAEEDKLCTLQKNEMHCLEENISSKTEETKKVKESTIELSHVTTQLKKSINETAEYYDKQIEEHLNKINQVINRMKVTENEYLQFLK